MNILYFSKNRIVGTSRAMSYEEIGSSNKPDVARHVPTKKQQKL